MANRKSISEMPEKPRVAERSKRMIGEALNKLRDARRNLPERLKPDTDLRALFESGETYLVGIADMLKAWEQGDDIN